MGVWPTGGEFKRVSTTVIANTLCGTESHHKHQRGSPLARLQGTTIGTQPNPSKTKTNASGLLGDYEGLTTRDQVGYNKVMKHNRVSNRIISTISIVGLAALILMLIFASPTEIGPFGVLVFFTTLYTAIFGVISLLLRTFYHFAFEKDILRTKDYLYAAVLAFGPIVALIVRSFGAINPWTVSLIALFLFLAEFLVYKIA